MALGRPVLHEVLVFVFILVTTPVTLVLLARATIYRDRSEGNADVPLPAQSQEPDRNP
jgi:multicomponent K+:H+ antiporter subunit G